MNVSMELHGYADMLKKYGFEEVRPEDILPGDIMCKEGVHVQIYAGDNQIYNAGGTDSIRNSAPYTTSEAISNYTIMRPVR